MFVREVLVEENLGRQPNFCLQQNRVLTYWRGQQFCDCYVLIEFLHLIVPLNVELCGAPTIWELVFDFCVENCVRPLQHVVAAKICVARLGHRTGGKQYRTSLHCFGAPPLG
jgi:hypothetical protein